MNRARRHFIVAAMPSAAGARWRPWVLRAPVVALGVVPLAHANPAREAALKAKLTYNLARFAQWPAATFALPSDPLVICVAHRSAAVAAAFVDLTGQMVAGHPTKVVVGADAASRPCQVLFVEDLGDGLAVALPTAAAASPTLTIGDGEGFASRGGMVALVNDNDTLRFDVNLKSLRGAQIVLSSQVLKLARQVRE